MTINGNVIFNVESFKYLGSFLEKDMENFVEMSLLR